jgi:hypothetical protein
LTGDANENWNYFVLFVAKQRMLLPFMLQLYLAAFSILSFRIDLYLVHVHYAIKFVFSTLAVS